MLKLRKFASVRAAKRDLYRIVEETLNPMNPEAVGTADHYISLTINESMKDIAMKSGCIVTVSAGEVLGARFTPGHVNGKINSVWYKQSFSTNHMTILVQSTSTRTGAIQINILTGTGLEISSFVSKKADETYAEMLRRELAETHISAGHKLEPRFDDFTFGMVLMDLLVINGEGNQQVVTTNIPDCAGAMETANRLFRERERLQEEIRNIGSILPSGRRIVKAVRNLRAIAKLGDPDEMRKISEKRERLETAIREFMWTANGDGPKPLLSDATAIVVASEDVKRIAESAEARERKDLIEYLRILNDEQEDRDTLRHELEARIAALPTPDDDKPKMSAKEAGRAVAEAIIRGAKLEDEDEEFN